MFPIGINGKISTSNLMKPVSHEFLATWINFEILFSIQRACLNFRDYMHARKNRFFSIYSMGFNQMLRPDKAWPEDLWNGIRLEYFLWASDAEWHQVISDQIMRYSRCFEHIIAFHATHLTFLPALMIIMPAVLSYRGCCSTSDKDGGQ